MKNCVLRFVLIVMVAMLPASSHNNADEDPSALQLNSQDALETHGLSVFLFHNSYHRVFGDEKMSGLEIVLHEQRIATNGDVRLSPTPAQWDPIPKFKERQHGSSPNELIAFVEYPDRDFQYRIDVRPEGNELRVTVILDKPVPTALAGKAGFNLELLPTAYFGKSYAVDDTAGIFPRHASGPMAKSGDSIEPVALASGSKIVLSPEDPLTRVTISSENGALLLFDGRNQAQNGWFVLRTLLPSDKTGEVVTWHIHPNVIPGWVRQPVIQYNQVGYTPDRAKVAVIALDPQFKGPAAASVLKLNSDGNYQPAFHGDVKPWGKWLRHNYSLFDFSAIRIPGIYAIEYAGTVSAPFRIDKNVYDGIWRLSLDTYLAEQMDHVKVREGYRI